MALQLELAPDLEAKLRERAAQSGRSPEAFVLEALREDLAAGAEPGESLSPSSRLAELNDWFTSHPTSKAAVLDDSRESIYNGRGE
jgi:plasmid stability protein